MVEHFINTPKQFQPFQQSNWPFRNKKGRALFRYIVNL